jgi:hypothetical protein
MADSPVVYALRRKYADLKGVLKYRAPDDVADLVLSIRQVGCVLRMFSPDEDLTAIKPIRPMRKRPRKWSRVALSIMRRDHRPMTIRELAHRVAAEKGAGPEDIPTIDAALCSLMERLEGHGVVRMAGEPKRWRVAQ